MTIDTIAVRNKRIKELEDDLHEWRDLALANEGRAQAAEARESALKLKLGELSAKLKAAEARVAELERERNEARAQLARADRLAEAAMWRIGAGHNAWCLSYIDEPCSCGRDGLHEALEAYRSPEPQPKPFDPVERARQRGRDRASVPEPHPDTVRLDWLALRAKWNRGVGPWMLCLDFGWGHELEGYPAAQPIVAFREAIDAAREGESDG